MRKKSFHFRQSKHSKDGAIERERGKSAEAVDLTVIIMIMILRRVCCESSSCGISRKVFTWQKKKNEF